MAVVMNNVHIHVRLYTSSTQGCLPYFRVPLVLTIPLPGVSDGYSDGQNAYPCEAMHQQYTGVLTLSCVSL